MAVVKRGAEFLAEGERLVDCCDAELCCTAGQCGTRGLQRTAMNSDTPAMALTVFTLWVIASRLTVWVRMSGAEEVIAVFCHCCLHW